MGIFRERISYVVAGQSSLSSRRATFTAWFSLSLSCCIYGLFGILKIGPSTLTKRLLSRIHVCISCNSKYYFQEFLKVDFFFPRTGSLRSSPNFENSSMYPIETWISNKMSYSRAPRVRLDAKIHWTTDRQLLGKFGAQETQSSSTWNEKEPFSTLKERPPIPSHWEYQWFTTTLVSALSVTEASAMHTATVNSLPRNFHRRKVS